MNCWARFNGRKVMSVYLVVEIVLSRKKGSGVPISRSLYPDMSSVRWGSCIFPLYLSNNWASSYLLTVGLSHHSLTFII